MKSITPEACGKLIRKKPIAKSLRNGFAANGWTEHLPAVYERTAALFADYPGANKPLMTHLRQLLPMIALYEKAAEITGSREAALDFVEKWAFIEAEKMMKYARPLMKLGLYRLMPSLCEKLLDKMFGEAAGFRYRRVPDAPKFAADMLRCPYVDACAKYDCPELAQFACKADDITYGNLHPKLVWERTQTLGTGGSCCDFRLYVKQNKGVNMRILIYGAGVIGCLYAALFAQAGIDTTVYARGQRLAMFRERGLKYAKGKRVAQANVRIVDKVAPDDVYDFVFLTVKENQVHTALKELRENTSSTIVTMVNTLEPYSAWEALCGEGRLLPAFPGAGGGFEGNVLHAALTPRLVQPTTFGEIGGRQTERSRRLAALFRKAHIPCQIVTDMHAWQLCHLAMVVPIADAYYEAEVPEKAGEDKQLMQRTAHRMQQNFRQLKRFGVKLSPKKMHLFHLLPMGLLSFGLRLVFRSRFGHTFMYKHSMNAPDEMRQLHEQFYGYLDKLGKRNMITKEDREERYHD